MAEYIEREALLELYENTLDCNIDSLSVPVEVVRQNIKDMTAADVAPVIHAHWMKAHGGKWRCSNCRGRQEKPSRFCKECGARMNERKDDEA